MYKSIFRSIWQVAVLSLLIAAVFMAVVMYAFFDKQLSGQLQDTTHYVLAGMQSSPDEMKYLDSIPPSDIRITWIAADGSVLFDSVSNPNEMENHLDRPEVQQALDQGEGSGSRTSATLQERTVYRAARLDDGSVLRLSSTSKSVWGLLYSMLSIMIWIILGITMLCALLARYVSRRIVQPLNEMDLDHPEQNDIYDELAPMLSRMYAQNKTIERQMAELRRRQRELQAIVDNMGEGLVLLDDKCRILSINKSAGRFFDTDADECLGEYALMLSRDMEYHRLIDQAGKGKSGQADMCIGGRDYQLLASPVKHGQAMDGIVLLVLDVTRSRQAERQRREFSANVSHELKTPLTAIMGYADIISNGLAQPQDIHGFAGRIHDEAENMLFLIDDIIKLSRLDEGKAGEQIQPLNVIRMLNHVVERLAPMAESNEVTIALSGDEASINGIPHVLEEAFYNLLNNAIKYNVAGGKVDIHMEKLSGEVLVTIADTGIGIPANQLDRVFERFYRVDKSHSRDTGGTGLGLAIARHGLELGGGSITLDSQEGQGTTVSIRFPTPNGY